MYKLLIKEKHQGEKLIGNLHIFSRQTIKIGPVLALLRVHRPIIVPYMSTLYTFGRFLLFVELHPIVCFWYSASMSYVHNTTLRTTGATKK